MADADRSRPDEDADPSSAASPATPSPADPPPGDVPSTPRIDRDPVALAAWRRVAEQRDRRRTAREDAEPADEADAPAAEGATDPWGASLRPPGFAPRSSSAAADAARADGPFGAPAEHGGPQPAGRVHDALLGFAGRIDDDALSSVRELVAVEDDAGAAELLGGCLLADAVALTPFERAVLGPWFGAARVDAGILGLLPTDPDAVDRVRHRFVAEGPSGAGEDGWGDAGEVARAVSRLPGVTAVGQCWRVTPAGAASGPVPHRVVLVQTEATVDGEHVAHHVAHAARNLGPVSVEVVAAGVSLPAYHRDALAVAVPMLSPVPPHPHPADEEWHTVAEAAPPPGVVSESDLLLGELPFGDAGSEPEPDAPEPEAPESDAPEPAPESHAPESDAPEPIAPGPTASETVASEPSAPDADAWSLEPDAESGEAEDREDSDEVEPARDEPTQAEPAWAEDVQAEDVQSERARDDERSAEPVDDGRPEPLEPDEAAARIAALWREPSPVDVFEERGAPAHGPVSSYDWGVERATPVAHEEPGEAEESEESGESGADPLPERADEGETPDPLPPGAGQVRRARTSRSVEGRVSAPSDVPAEVDVPATTPSPQHVNGYHHGAVNGAHHGPEAGVDDDPPTDPIGWSFGPTPPGPARHDPARHDPGHHDPARHDPAEPSRADTADTATTASAATSTAPAAPTTPAGPTITATDQGLEVPDGSEGSTEALGLPAEPGTVPDRPDDSIAQLSEREQELLARLHDELAARERAGSDLFEAPGSTAWGHGSTAAGRPPAEEPDPAPPTAPLPPSLPDGSPGDARGQVNGHGLPPRGDADERED